jgi:hypothetical protein
MKRTSDSSTATRWFSRLTIILGGFLASQATAEAGLTLTSSSGSVTYGIFGTTTGSSNAVYKSQTINGFNENTVLLAPGNGLPSLTTLASSSGSYSSNNLNPFFLTSSNNSSSSYGSATTEIYVAGTGQQGSFTTQGGVYWSLNTSLSDNLGASSNQASVSFSIANATYMNNTNNTISFDPGAILSVAGTIGSSSSYVAAGLATTITVTNNSEEGPITTSTNLDTITLAANGAGVKLASTGNGPFEYGSVSVLGGVLSGTGTSLDSSMVYLNPGDTISISSYLTLISDPGSSVGITDNLPLDFPSGSQYIPGFGAYGESPSVVPEPSTIVLLGGGLAMVGFWNRTSRRKRTTKD